MFGNDGLRLNILRGEIFPHYWENKEDKDFNLNDDINIELCDSDFNNKSDDLLRRGQLWLTLEAKNKYHINKLVFSTWSAPAWMKSNGKVSNGKLKPECYQDFANYLAAFTKLTNQRNYTLCHITLKRAWLCRPLEFFFMDSRRNGEIYHFQSWSHLSERKYSCKNHIWRESFMVSSHASTKDGLIQRLHRYNSSGLS